MVSEVNHTTLTTTEYLSAIDREDTVAFKFRDYCFINADSGEFKHFWKDFPFKHPDDPPLITARSKDDCSKVIKCFKKKIELYSLVVTELYALECLSPQSKNTDVMVDELKRLFHINALKYNRFFDRQNKFQVINNSELYFSHKAIVKNTRKLADAIKSISLALKSTHSSSKAP